MSLSSIPFIFIFLPAFLLVYYCIPTKYQSYSLLAGSVCFYCLNAPSVWWLLLPLAEIALTYFAALAIHKNANRKRYISPATVVILFGTLLFFKYAGLFTGAGLALPVGISFFTFQLCGYLADVSSKELEASENILQFTSGVLFFPKLLAGPIPEWRTVSPQLTPHKFEYSDLDTGLREFIAGLGLKVLLADRLGGLWRQVSAMGFDGVSTSLAWLGLLAYSMQLYFDFYGYSKMATGLARMLGFELPINFDYPYASRSLSEFWRRWHITLGAWFRKYIYIPLGGNRKGFKRQLINLAVVWLCTAIWHGSTLNFLLWGLFVYALIVMEKKTGLDKSKSPLMHVYLVVVSDFSWSFFAVTNLKQLGLFLKRLFTFFSHSAGVNANDFALFGKKYIVFILIGALFCFPWIKKVWDRIKSTPLGTVILFLIFWGSVFFLSIGQNDPFMYAGF